MIESVAGTLRVLVCEDREDDFELLLLELRAGGHNVVAKRVESAAELRAALTEHWDVVISDWSMPSFTAPDALAIVHQLQLDIPFLIVSGTVDEETAVEALRGGAHDFLSKLKLTRLNVAIERELREAQTRRERAKMQEQLMVSDRMASVGILAAGVAHEINNPLAAVIANLDLALSDIENVVPEAVRTALREELTDALAAADRVRNIVRDVRIFSRSEEEERGPVDAQSVMESTLRMASNEIRHRAHVMRSYEKIPPVDATEARLGQVFLNLVVNAAQAIPAGKAHQNQIRVGIKSAGERAKVTIADTGPGIPDEVMKRLFTPFVTTKPAATGTGLGLSICRRIVDSFGGEISVDSTVGEGTEFTLLLPWARRSAEVHLSTPLPLRPAARRGRILVIDDDVMVTRAVQRALAAEHDVTLENRAAAALASIREGARYDVIVCDLMMPEMTGAELHHELTRTAHDQAAAMIFLTGGAFTGAAQDFLDTVANAHVEKPFEPANLRAVINARIR